MKVLFIGDINGKPGRQSLENYLFECRKNHIKYDFIIANVENAAAGFGLTKEISRKVLEAGVDCQTSGNHIWDKKEIYSYFEVEPRLLRPANYPSGAPGLGYNIYDTNDGDKIAVINLQGRIFMANIDCPFKTVDRILSEIPNETRAIFIDFHAEATSEKQALGWYLNGRVSAVVGTHTHVQTVDEKILSGGTAFITDVGMTGPYDSVIGVEIDDALYRIVSGLPNRFTIAQNDVRFAAVVVDIDPATGKASSIERIFRQMNIGDDPNRKQERF
ncbi:MAG: TIGR00282 family metallophosphoesterase [candidate division Zixibacteria bacterium]